MNKRVFGFDLHAFWGMVGHLVLAAGCVLAWVFIVFLSGALYQGNTSVFSATLFTVSVSLFLLGTCCLVVKPFDVSVLLEKRMALFLGGLVFLALASLLPCFGYFQGLNGFFPPVILGAVTGAGLSLTILSLLLFLTNVTFAQAVAWHLASLALGIVLFIGYMTIVSQELMSLMLWIFPLLVGGFLFIERKKRAKRRAVFTAYARSLAHSQMRGMFEHGAFGAFIVISGFLFGYCYNIYPKTTRFAGVYTDAIIGLVSPAAVIFLLVCQSVVIVLVLVQKIAGRTSAYAFGCLLLVSLAALYFSLPNMPNSWMLFVLLDSAAVSIVLFVFVGSILSCSEGDKAGFSRRVVLLATGVALGTLTAALFIEMTVPDPAIVLPEPARDIVIVGTPALGFIALALILFVLARNMFFPEPLITQEDRAGFSGLEAAARSLAVRFLLTPREEEIIGMLLQGRSGPYISEDLYVSKSTVKTHIRHIYDKTGVSSRQQLIDLAHNEIKVKKP